MFGVDARVGLTSSSLPDELIAKIDSEEHLSDLANMELSINTDDENTCTTDDEAMEISEPQPTELKTDMCVVCEATALNVHALCGKSIITEDFPSKVICILCDTETVIEKERANASESMVKQANRIEDTNEQANDSWYKELSDNVSQLRANRHERIMDTPEDTVDYQGYLVPEQYYHAIPEVEVHYAEANVAERNSDKDNFDKDNYFKPVA
ncbi:unnamed protein product [Mytilus coruscus]|uniref:SCAN domain-containing protein n=1 Tax=Mytilus coruscus TaxID=42192 RepID=A0A6J8DQQ6_MYTCO|nr:unnamed protein product [Mytilus coruscus]